MNTIESVIIVIDRITCQRCGYPYAEHQHEPHKTMGVLYCPKCEGDENEQ